MGNTGDKCDHFEADQQEQDRIQKLVEHFPELDDVVAGNVAHGEGDAMIADQESRDRHRQRTRDVESGAKGISAHHDCQSDRHFKGIFVHRTHRAKAEPAEQQTDDEASARLDDEQARAFADGELGTRNRCSEEDGENDDADAIIEQAFACYGGLQTLLDLLFLQHPEDGNGIGRCDQGTEDEIPDRGNHNADERTDAPHREAREYGRQYDAYRRQE